MMIPLVPFALDSESDTYIDGEKKTRLLQWCDINAKSLEDVQLLHSWDAWNIFFDMLDGVRSRKKVDIHVFNLAYEFSHMWAECLQERYPFVDAKKPQKGSWSAVADHQSVYVVTFVNQYGTLIRFTDDMKRFGGVSMRKASASVRAQHPNWFPMEETKLESDYHEGWLNPDDPDFEHSLEYSIQDAFSQAMCTRFLVESGFDAKLTAPSNGLDVALRIRYKQGQGKNPFLQSSWNRNMFKEKYPPLDRAMQDIAEASLLGGYVYGETGTFFGQHTHVDYSSSYPYEYAFGDLFIGSVSRVFPSDKYWQLYLESKALFKWKLVSFDFELKEGMMGAISGKECVGNLIGRWNKKMRTGRVSRRLYTETYLEELGRHYEITNLEVHEIWLAKRMTGDFKEFIKYCYEMKQHMKNMGRKDWVDYLLWKLFMNGGVHGKTITKTHRKKKVFFDGESRFVEEVNEPELNFMIGFTAMSNARERLLKHCRMIIEAGYHVRMCDTDSIVCDCTPDELKEIIGDWFVKGGDDMEGNLGRFEIEGTFNKFKCWGLKRYAEIEVAEDGTERLMKTAFAGMHVEGQRRLLDWDTDGTEYQWKQSGKKTMKYGATIVEVTKHAKAENVWDEGPYVAPEPNPDADLSEFWRIYAELKKNGN